VSPLLSSSTHQLIHPLSSLWGNPNHLRNVTAKLREAHPEDKLHILVATRNSGNFTYDGIEVGGERVCHEIEEELKRLRDDGTPVKKLSMVGYSLGGLVARYTAGLLEAKGYFTVSDDDSEDTKTIQTLTPINFTTFATPHLGVRSPQKGLINQAFNVLGARTLSVSGQQLFLIDSFRQTGKPLLEAMTQPDSVFVKALARFRRRTCYANIVNDRSATFYTTSISRTDPFAELHKIQLAYLPGYDDVIVDPHDPVAAKPSDAPPAPWGSTLAANSRLLGIGLILPVAVLALLGNAAVQTYTSAQRIALHERGEAGVEISGYRSFALEKLEEVRERVEQAYEELGGGQKEDYLSRSSEESTGGDQAAGVVNGGAIPATSTPSPPAPSSSSDNGWLLQPKTLTPPTPTLALTPSQFSMIRAMDALGWRRYPVHIHGHTHSHAAIIARREGEGFREGFVVLRHWLDREFDVA
jgi:hypothetical protein